VFYKRRCVKGDSILQRCLVRKSFFSRRRLLRRRTVFTLYKEPQSKMRGFLNLFILNVMFVGVQDSNLSCFVIKHLCHVANGVTILGLCIVHSRLSSATINAIDQPTQRICNAHYNQRLFQMLELTAKYEANTCLALPNACLRKMKKKRWC
jgi:hypothetical protein